MNVARCHNRFTEFLAELNNFPVQILQVFLRSHVRDTVTLNHKPVVPDRLYLIVVVEIRQSGDLLGGALLQNCLVKFSRLTGAANEKTFSVFI